MAYWIVIACTTLVELYVLRRLRFDWFIALLALIGMLVSMNYLAYTSIFERNYDGPSQILYIDEIAKHHRLPPVSIFCAACGHPPLYYVLAALWSQTVMAGDWIPRELGLQWLSVLLSFGFVVFALLLLRVTIGRPVIMRLAAALVIFWPSGIISSVRVHNDALASTLMIASMYFISRWDWRGRDRDFYWAVAATALALLTKSSGYTMAVTLVAMAALRLVSTRFSSQSIKQCATAVVVLCCAALLAVSFRVSTHQRVLCQKVLGNACDMPGEVYGSSKLSNYFHFDLADFVRQNSSVAYPRNQDYFWNGLAKSSLFGATPLGKDFASETHKQLEACIRLLLLAMVAVCVVTLPFIRSVRWRRYRAIIGATASMFILLVAFHYIVPNPYHADLRHVFPVLVPLCLLYAKVVERLSRWSHVLHKAGIVIGLLMVASSVAFFVRLR